MRGARDAAAGQELRRVQILDRGQRVLQPRPHHGMEPVVAEVEPAACQDAGHEDAQRVLAVAASAVVEREALAPRRHTISWYSSSASRSTQRRLPATTPVPREYAMP